MTECIKLCASSKYSDKRVAYLGLMILVDETEEILMLMTNCLKQDLNSTELQIVSLALNVLGDISSVEMVRDLLPEIEKHIVSNNFYIRKKAALAAVRAVRKLTPEETRNILQLVPTVFDVKSPAVHISGTALVAALCRQDSESLNAMQLSMTPVLLNILHDHLLGRKARSLSESLSETVIGGIRNPFLQVKVITALRELVVNGASKELVKRVSDVLAQVASNTDGTKVAGCAVLYECVKTIIVLDTEKSLRALAVSILGKFLSHKESTVRYVALQELTHVIDADGSGVLVNIDGYKEKVVAGMREADPTVRKRAVELVYRIADEGNVQEIVKELLDYIDGGTSRECKQDGCWKIFNLLDRFGPTDQWKVETFIKALSSADTAMPEELITSFIALVSSKPHVQAHAVQKLFAEALSLKPSAENQAKGEDPFSSESHVDSSAATKSVSVRRRKPRLERVALYILGEHGEASSKVGLKTPQVLDAFDTALIDSEAADESWMNTYDSRVQEENVVLSEVALSGLVKFAARTLAGSGHGGGLASVNDSLLAITKGAQPASDGGISSILALPASKKQESSVQDLGLGTDLLASMGLGEDGSSNRQAGNSNALVPVSNALTIPQRTDALMSLQEVQSLESGNPVVDRVREILLRHARHHELETQQRACEYLMLLNESLLSTLSSTMASMPPLDFNTIHEKAKQRKEMRMSRTFTDGGQTDGLLLDLLDDSTDVRSKPLALPAGGNDLLALPASGSDFLSLPAPANCSIAGPSGIMDSESLSLDALIAGGLNIVGSGGNTGDIDLASVGAATTKGASASQALASERDAPGPRTAILSTIIFESDALRVFGEFFKGTSDHVGNTRLELMFANKSDIAMLNFVFLLAVPPHIKLQMHPASAAEIASGDEATQSVNLINSLHGQKPVQLKYRVEYTRADSGQVERHQGVVAGLDSLQFGN